MSFRGNEVLAHYRTFVRRFVGGYLLVCCLALAALMVVDAVFPQARVYERIRGFLRAALEAGVPPHSP